MSVNEFQKAAAAAYFTQFCTITIFGPPSLNEVSKMSRAFCLELGMFPIKLNTAPSNP